jgi:son of sevenless-like protein
MNGIAGTTPPGAMYVRALYDYEADDRTSLSFHEGDVIQVITQLESGWWDGVINGVRGWFPSNYCQAITSPDDLPDLPQNGHLDHLDEDAEEADLYDEAYEQDDDSEGEGISGLPLEGTDGGDKSRADFWIPQATPDGRLFYYNMMTGDRSMELPLESPISSNEMGPRDRMNVVIPEKTRPPPEMMARGLTQDEDYDSATSLSEVEGDHAANGTRGARVRCFKTHHTASLTSLADTITGHQGSSLRKWCVVTFDIHGFHQRHAVRWASTERHSADGPSHQWPDSQYRVGHIIYKHNI